MAADVLSAVGLDVTVYEQMPSFGRKFLMAGRGGLNITHSEPLDYFLMRYGNAQPHLEHIIRSFDPNATLAWCDALGQPTFTGSTGRVFPKAMKASPLLRTLLTRLQSRAVDLNVRYQWQGWDEEGRVIFNTPMGRQCMKPDAVLLALGGASWPKLGSTGTWVKLLAERGVKIAPLRAANCGLLVNWSDHFKTHFAGQPLKSIALKFGDTYVRGEVMITQTGIEGGVVYSISSAVREACDTSGSAGFTIDLKPDVAIDVLRQKLKKRRKGASVANWLRQSLGLAPVAINLLREVMYNESDGLADLIKNIPVSCHGVASLDRAISTAGGVLFSECDENLMLKKIPGTFVAGEMLDWEAPTGGYLLQATLATGVAAAVSIRRYLA